MRRYRKVPIQITAIIMVVVGVICLIVSAVFNNDLKKHRENCSETVIAQIVDEKTRKNSDGYKEYTPVFSYEYNGKRYESYINIYDQIFGIKYLKGLRENIKINPDDPEEIYLEDISERAIIKVWGLQIIGAVFGGIGLIIIIGSVVKLLIVAKLAATSETK
ncbi:MAG: DUF3592 domain-containing protein [Lachnospiraceae bacterium]|nr:DUF3592 domain-containing protein [Lachnospiraceae bacterium]